MKLFGILLGILCFSLTCSTLADAGDAGIFVNQRTFASMARVINGQIHRVKRAVLTTPTPTPTPTHPPVTSSPSSNGTRPSSPKPTVTTGRVTTASQPRTLPGSRGVTTPRGPQSSTGTPHTSPTTRPTTAGQGTTKNGRTTPRTPPSATRKPNPTTPSGRQATGRALGGTFHALNKNSSGNSSEELQEFLDSFTCAPKCLANMSEALNKSGKNTPKREDLHGNTMSLMDDLSDPEALEKFCKIYRDTHKCIASCPDTPFGDIITKGLTIPDYICIKNFDAYKRHGPCLRNVTDSLEATCNKTCANYIKATENFTRIVDDDFSEAYFGKIDSLNQFLGNTCQLIDCYTNCFRGDVTKKCGNDAMKLIDEFDTVTVSWLLDMTDMINTSDDYPPKECKKFSGKATVRHTKNHIISFGANPRDHDEKS